MQTQNAVAMRVGRKRECCNCFLQQYVYPQQYYQSIFHHPQPASMTIALPASSKIIFLDYIFSKGPFFIKIGFVNCNYQTNNLICFILLILMVSAFSVPKAKRDEKPSSNPGPGQYNPQNSPKVVKNTDPLYSFGKDIRRFEKSSNPGPGAYEPKSTLVAEKKPSFSMLSRRDLLEEKLNVGPGQYSPVYQYGKFKQPSFSMRPKFGEKSEVFPGPGNYEYKSHLATKYKGNNFGRESRVKDEANKVPGPGSYTYQKAIFKYESKQEPSYGFGSRLSQMNSMKVPGPGSYEPKREIFSHIGGKVGRDSKDSLIASKTPGPGAYQSINHHKEKYPSWSLSKSARDARSGDGFNLGPGQYDHTNGFKKVSGAAPAYGFSGNSQKLKEEINHVPGPGTYESRLLLSRKSVKIGERLKDLDSSRVPGPGSYEQFKYDNDAWLKGSGRYSISKDLKLKEELNRVPGPGAYENKSTDLKAPRGKVSFGKDEKIKFQVNKNPGPGHYDLKPTFADVPKYLLP